MGCNQQDDCTENISAPKIEEEKRRFWENLDKVVGGIPTTEKLFVKGDLNGDIGILPGGYDNVHGGFGLGDMNWRGVALLEFARAFGMVITNSRFLKKEEHLVTFRSSMAKTQIDFLLLRKVDKENNDPGKSILVDEPTITAFASYVHYSVILVKIQKVSSATPNKVVGCGGVIIVQLPNLKRHRVWTAGNRSMGTSNPFAAARLANCTQQARIAPKSLS
ncbi:hypothetical protein RND71_016360 [Anisodus tanguticus]|uniref:Craniofacial development protein 2-like n=1 Tax=Anisodus tanguticus TaxID=243964 RepID=A0AAE1VDP9_9SOLA|nr:hypothetical protein RND71_016360 [Anisodus tanguticus]